MTLRSNPAGEESSARAEGLRHVAWHPAMQSSFSSNTHTDRPDENEMTLVTEIRWIDILTDLCNNSFTTGFSD